MSSLMRIYYTYNGGVHRDLPSGRHTGGAPRGDQHPLTLSGAHAVGTNQVFIVFRQTHDQKGLPHQLRGFFGRPEVSLHNSAQQ